VFITFTPHPLPHHLVFNFWQQHCVERSYASAELAQAHSCYLSTVSLHTTSCTNRALFLSSSRALVVGAISEPHHPEAGLDVKVWGMYDRS